VKGKLKSDRKMREVEQKDLNHMVVPPEREKK
jgi:hypothetical protein